jgi:hypothetical protein
MTAHIWRHAFPAKNRSLRGPISTNYNVRCLAVCFQILISNSVLDPLLTHIRQTPEVGYPNFGHRQAVYRLKMESKVYIV